MDAIYDVLCEEKPNQRLQIKIQSEKLENNHIEVIGIDHGWANMKTIIQVFTSAVKKITTEPALYDNVLEYEGKYYKIGCIFAHMLTTCTYNFLLLYCTEMRALIKRGVISILKKYNLLIVGIEIQICTVDIVYLTYYNEYGTLIRSIMFYITVQKALRCRKFVFYIL